MSKSPRCAAQLPAHPSKENTKKAEVLIFYSYPLHLRTASEISQDGLVPNLLCALKHHQALSAQHSESSQNVKAIKSLSTATQLTLSNQPEHLLIEQDLLTNPNNQSLWNSYIHRLTKELEREIKEQRGKATQIENQLLGSKLETKTRRRAYQILVSVYERALIYFPKSFKLWKDYLQLRQAFILGQPKKKFNPSSNKKKQPNDQSLTVLDHISKSQGDLRGWDCQEQYISTLMDSLGENSEGEDGEGGKSSEELELDQKMKEFEELMDRRPFLVNDVLLRRNPNDVQEWEKRVVLYGEDQDEKVVETYLKAIETINPKKATSNFNQLFIHFAKWYEENGVDPSDDSLPDLDSARKVFERAINVNFQRVDDLAEIWIEWAEMEVQNEKYTEALRVIRRATTVPPNHKKKAISFHDESLAVQVRLFKSLKLWSFRVDLEESIGTVESTQKAYDTIFELKIANAQFMKRYQGTKIERARDLFEQALENCPEKFVKPIFLSYAQLEESFGLAKRAMGVLERATEKVALDDRFEMFAYYIAKATENFGLPATRPIYEKAIKSLPNNQTAEMCLRFANLEQKLGEIDRARAIYAHSSQFCDPRTSPKFWETYHNFEIQHGSEDTFREMLRIKRAVQASFNTKTSYLAAKAAAARAAGSRGGGATVSQQQDEDDETGSGDPMRRLEKDDPASSSTAGNQAFVLSKDRQAQLDRSGPLNPDQQSTNTSANVDEIAIDDDDD
ncbi:pre-mRNA-splicing factor syf1 [Puccinia graminis f. sp. tritici]|uniref:Pre-mRNA-splicing factor SYF1 n=1 Tax=Puccinia graminis f. sp. tritici TaxID=56615 RepID=A0A5B0R6X8_PUCGR|nr:pre-mRNA-splicing factor syf1 [Puccinia graminis f. sp. tritici]